MTWLNRPARPTGDVSRRIHGARSRLQAQAASARRAARAADQSGEPLLAASLRGKLNGYREAIDLLDRIDTGRRLPPRRRDQVTRE